MTELIIKAYDVLEELTNLCVFIKLKELNKIIEEKYNQEIKTFKNSNLKFNEILNLGGSYHPEYKKIASNLSKAKKALYEKKEMLEYLELEKEYQDILNEFLNEMINIISPNIKRKTDFFKGVTCHVR